MFWRICDLMTAAAVLKPELAPGEQDVLDRATDAALHLLTERPWRDITLRDLAMAADVPFADLYMAASNMGAVADHIARRIDAAAMGAAGDPSPDVGDRLFEVIMARLEAMAPYRAALISILDDEGPFAPRRGVRLAAAARAMLEGAGVDTRGRRGAVRVLAMITVWARVVTVWRDDEGALNRTMAEIDKLLKQMRKRLNQVGAGF